MDSQEQARAQRARRALADALTEVDQTFYPRHVGKVIAWSVKRSFRRHTPAWAVVGGVTGAILVGLAVWALVSDDDEV